MAKKNLYTSSSKENLQNLLNQLRQNAYQPLSNNVTNNYSSIVNDLPTIELPEPTIEEQSVQDSSYEDEGFFTKLGNKIKEKAEPYIPETDYKGKNPFENKKKLKDYSKQDFKAILDPTFAFGEGWIQNNIDAPAGKMLLNSREKADLQYQKDFLELQKEMKSAWIKLNQAQLENDQTKIAELSQTYNALEQAYLSGFDSYRELAGKKEYYDKYGKQENASDRIDAINKRLTELAQENEELNNDLQSGREQLHNLQSIYQISPEYKKLESEKWYYQVPRAAGTSATSLMANAGSFAVQAGSQYLANQVIAGYGGIYGQMAAGAAAIIGAGSNVAANLWARDQESLSEVANNYKSNIQQYAYDNNIDINAIAEIGREQLRKVTGKEYSSDQDSPNYRSNEEVFEDMLAYDVATNNTDLDILTATTKKNLQNIYDRNMILATSDIAQSAMIIPGAGKMFSKVLNKLNLPERAIDGTVKIIDKAIDYTVSKQISNAAKKGISKYIVDPAVRITASAGLEGLEETTQYIIGSKINKQDEANSINWYNPFDVTKVFVQNQYDGLKGLAAIAGISGDPALDNDEELVNNFKVGAALGLLMGGSFQAVSATRNYKNYNAGRELARNTMTNYIQAKEDIFKYKQYADKAMNNSFNKEAFFEGMNEQFNQETLPEGFTQDDLTNEKNNIEQIYNIVNNNRIVKKLNKQDRSTGAALLKHYYDEYQNAYNTIITNNINPELNNKIEQDVQEFIELNNIPEDKKDIVKNYLSLLTQQEAYNDYKNTLSEFNDTEYTNDESKEALDELLLKQSELERTLNALNNFISRDNDLNKVLTENSSLNKSFQEVKDDTIRKFINDRELRKAKNNYTELLNDSKKLKQKIDKYNESQNLNRQAVEEERSNINEESTVEYGNPTIDEEEVESVILPEEETTDNITQDNSTLTTESTSENNSDKQKETIVPEASPSVTTEESKKEPTTINLLEEASFYDEESYSETDTDEQIFDDNLTEEDFVEQSDLQPEQSVEPEDKSELSTEQITTEDVENTIIDNQTISSNDNAQISDTKSVTFDSDLLGRPINQEDVDNTVKYDNDEQYEEPQTNLVNGTLFYQFSDTPLKSGYESGNALNEFLSTPGNISKAKFTAFVEPSDYEYGKYNPNDKSTWDNAAIRIEILSNDGRKFITSLKTIEGAEMLYISQGKQLSNKEKNQLRDLRNTIVEAKLNNPNAEITFKTITYTNGKINKESENRNLREINGLNIPSDLHDLFNTNIKFGIGKGIVGNFMIVDQNGMPLNGRGGSGKIFVYPAPESTINGEQTPIQLNEQRFANDDGTPTELANYLANLFVYRDSGDPGLYFEDLQQLILNYGESSLIKPGDPREDFLADKQFYINYKEGWAQLGRDKVNINQLRSDAGVARVAQFIANNLHWNTEKNLLWKSLPKSFRDYLLDNNMDKVEIVPGLTFDLEDVGLIRENGRLITDTKHPDGLSTLAWMIKYGKLKSNVADRLFTEPFVYVGEPIITLPKQEVESNINLLELADFGDEPQQDEVTLPNTNDSNYDPFTDPYSKEVMDFFNFDAPTKRMKRSEVERQKKINTVKAKKWLKSKLGLNEEQIDIVDGVIRQFANGEAVYGIANADGIAISNMAVEGVQYHEAWHRVSLLYLDNDTRNKLYTEFKKQHPKLSKVSDKVLEEAIADSFMDYMLNDKESKFRYYINKIFRNIKKLLGLQTSLGKASLNNVFDMIKYGDFSKYKMDQKSLKSFMDSYKDGAFYKVGRNMDVSLKYFPTIHEFESALDSLKSCLFIANGTKYLSDISNLDNNKLKQFLQNYSKSKFVSEEQKNALNEIIENFDTFMYHLQPRLEQMGIRAIEQSSDEDFANRELTGIQNYDKAAYEFDKKNNALASVKMFIATLADTYFDENNILRTRTNAITGLPMIVDYDEAYSLILNNLSTVENYSPIPGQDPSNSLLGKCAELSKFNPFFAFLYKRLNSVLDSNLETQILQTIKSFNQNFIETAYSTDNKGNAVFTVKDTINKQATKTFPSTWSDLFFNSDLIIQDNDKIYPNIKKIEAIIDEYNNLFNSVRNNTIVTNADARNYINDLVKIFNKIGIDVDEVTIEGLLDQTNRIESLKSLITSTQRGSIYHLINGTIKSTMGGNQTYTVRGVQKVRSLDTVYMGLGVDNIIHELSQVQAITHPNDTGISALGPNNNLVYTKTLNCYVSDLIRWLNQKDERTLVNLNNDPYCRSSLILQSANNNNYLRLNTFLNFYGDQSGDKGRDYLSISPVEDYINKINLTWNNHIIFPTMADKKTWFTITGVNLFNKEIFIRQEGNKLKLQFNRDALRYLYSAWEDEYNAIVNYYNTLSSVKKPIKNYHTSGKGGLFRHFTGFYVNRNGQNVWVDLNAQIKEAIAFDKKHKSNLMLRSVLEQIKEELFTDPTSTYNKINNNLLIELQNELKTCEELGIIQKDDNNPKLLKNKLLDSRIFEHFVNIYKANVNPNIAANAERYAIFTIIGNHMINQNVSTLETEKIITGDVAFYKNDDDKIKRLGAVLSTGDNLRTQWLTNDPNKIDLYRRLNNRDTYTCAIFNDNEIPSSQYELIKDLFEYDNFRNLLIERENLSEQQVDKLMKNEDDAKKKYPELAALAETLSTEDASAYGLNKKKTKGNINQADAAVYIRPEMYEQIVRRLGEWSPEVEEAFKILESDEDWLSNKELYAKSLKTLIKALKTTYFGYTYNADLGYNVPVFNKMAMFPMFKALATGDNREIYDRMNAVGKYAGLQPIDQIAFESAVKVGIEGGFSFYSDYTNNSINDMTNIHTTTQYFRNLRRQLITDPHTHDRTLFGTQVSTVAVSNLIMDRVYGNESNVEAQRTGQQLKEQLFGTINALSNKGMQSVRSEFMSDGQLDLDKTSKSLIREAHSSNMGKNIEDALQYNEDEQDFEVSLAALPDSKWVETKIIANTNHKAIDLELPGGAFIQMSSFGFKSIKTVGSSAIANGKRLININEDGSMDAIISINLFRHVIPNFDKISFTEAKEWLKKAGIIYDENNPDKSRPIAVGYRIPTQGLSSIAGLRIKDVLPSNVGDMIVLPDEFTTQTGSDFDIDKLYIARYNFDKDGNKIEFKGIKKIITSEGYVLEESFKQYLRRRFAEENEESYEVSERGSEAVEKLYNSWLESIGNPTNIYEANSREANENLLLDTYLTVLTDKKVVDQTRLPLDKVTGIIKDEILPIVDGEVNKSEHMPFKELSPTYQMNKKYEYSGGKTGIGPFALNNKNHILTQLAKLRFKENPLLQSLGFTGLDGINSKDEQVYKRDSKGNVVYDSNNNAITVEDKGLRILDWISAMINAHVDVAKDPYVIRLNVRQYTYNICNFLLRVGYGKSTFYFLPQRILKDMAVAYEAASGIYGVNSSKSKTATVNEEITKIRKKYFNLYEEACKEANVNIELNQSDDGTISFNDLSVNLNNVASTIMDRDNLITLLQDNKKLDNLTAVEKAYYYKQQLLISELFLQLNDLSQDMSKLVQLSQIDTKRYGNNFVEQNRFLYRLNSLIVNSNLFEAEDIINYYRNTFLETKLINGIVEPAEIFQSLMFRSNKSFKDAISKVLLMTNRIDTNDESLNKTISNELEGSLRQQFLESKNIDTFDLLYGDNSMAHRLAKIKSDILNSKYEGMLTQDGKIANKLLNHLGTLTRMSTDKYFAPNIITKNRINDGDKYLKQTLSVYWEELLDSPYEEIRSFANDLFYYQLATTAGNFTKNGIFGVTPIRLIKESGYNQFMRNQVKTFMGDASINYDDLFLNNWQNNKLVKSVELYKDAFDQESNEIVPQLTVPVLFSNTLLPGLNKRYPILMQLNNPSVAKNGKGQDVFQPYVKVVLDKTTPQGTLLYKLIGYIKNKQGIDKPIYALVNKKGLNESGRVVKEYNKYSNSIFEFNNISNALNAKKQINDNILNQLISTGDINKKEQWVKLLKGIEYIDDYIPETKALNLDIFRKNAGKNIIKKQNVSVVNIDSNQQSSNNTYTFGDGFTVDIPFKLNDQQVELLANLEYFYRRPAELNNIITISGYAGTGKTTIIGIFNKWLEHKGVTPIFSSPTHRANAVTKMNNPESIVMTLHSIFGLSPIVDLESGNYDLRKLKTEQVFKPKIKPNQFLIIDESSMISEGLYNFIQDYVDNFNVRVIFLGDPAQLSPVKDTNLSPVFKENNTKLQLTKVERTGDNPILKEATSLRNGNPLSYVTEIINGEGVEYMATNSSRVDEVLNEVVNSEEFKNNPLYFKVLAATNAVVQQTNLKVREQRFGKNAPQLMPGDILMGYSNITDNEKELVRNSIDYIVDSVSEIADNTIQVLDGKSLTVKGYNIVLRNAFNGEIGDKLFILDNNTSATKLKEISDLIEYFNRKINDAFKSHDYRLIGALQQALSEIQRNTILIKDVQQGQALKVRKTLDYGYACTVHKSQGGTYNKIMYYADTVAPFDKKVQNQLDYVAVSRAKENVYIVTNHEIKEQMSKDTTTETNDQNYVLHSGGAIGSDTMWSDIGKEYGIVSNHYYSGNKTPNGNIEISEADKVEGQQKVTIAARQMGRIEPNQQVRNELLIRDWAQVKYADSVFAITTMLSVGDEMNYGKKAKIRQGKGGTGYAMQMAINEGKPVYIYDQVRKQWYKNIDSKWSTSDVPVLTNNFAGIGTREINQDGIQAIKDVYNKTFGKQSDVKTVSSNKITRAITNYNRQSALANPRTLYIFTDNTDRTSGGAQINDGWYKNKYGNGGYGSDRNPTTAVIRGLDNAAPISTMRYFYRNHPNMSVNEARWTDNDLNEFKKVIDNEISDIKLLWDSGDFDNIVVPAGDRFFNSRIANISKERTPKLYQYLHDKLIELNNYVNGTKSEVQTINIYSGTGDNVDLSNFAERPFVYQNTRFKTVEGAFQAQKLNYSNYIDSSMSQRYTEMLNKFANATGYEARTLGRSISSLDRQMWDRDSEAILKETLKASFEQNPNAKQRLLDTGDAILTHKDKYGKEQDNGRFSRLLTEIREEFRNEPQSQKYTGNLLEQADFSEFNEMREEGKKIADICKNK